MYLRTTTRKNRDGSRVEYLQLAHSRRDPVTGTPKAEVLYNFGRSDSADRDALKRLIRSINRFLGPEAELKELAKEYGDLRFLESRPLGSAWLLRELWKQLGIERELVRLAQLNRRSKQPEEVERAVFSMVANRALEPMSKHATPEWLEKNVYAPEVPQDLYDERLYRAMDFLLTGEAELQKAVFSTTADLLNLEVDLLWYDTTSTYVEMEWDDRERQERREKWGEFGQGQGPEPTRPRPQVVNDPPFRVHGYSRDKRPDRPQVVVGLAVTREGIPVRCWTFPGNTNDATTVKVVKESLRGWKLNRVVWAVDRGMVSEENLAELRKGGADYIVGEKLRDGKKEVEQVLSHPGRYQKVEENLEVKEVVLTTEAGQKRYVVVRNPYQQARDAEDREKLLARIREDLEKLPEDTAEHTKQVCELFVHRKKGRYLCKDRKGRLVIDQAKVKEEERLDGKYLVVTSDETLSAAEVALGYKQLLEVERAWRTLKSELDLRPLYHRLEDRIRAHVLLCWLALLLVRVIEVKTDETWSRVRQELDRLHRGVFACPSGRFAQRTELTALQQQYFKAVGVNPPPRFEDIRPQPTPKGESSV